MHIGPKISLLLFRILRTENHVFEFYEIIKEIELQYFGSCVHLWNPESVPWSIIEFTSGSETTGRLGPMVRDGLNEFVKLSSGIQRIQIPKSGWYEIFAKGADNYTNSIRKWSISSDQIIVLDPH